MVKLVMADINITVYRWAGAWGPFKITIPCGECSLTKDVIADTIDNELSGISVEVEMRDWLTQWWKPILKGGWHAPIVLVDGKLVSQGAALNRGVLTQAVVDTYARKKKIKGNHLFGKASCPHCQRAKQYLNEANIEYRYHDVVKEPRGLYEMLARVKPVVGSKTPITVPQIWIEGEYIGGADRLSELLHRVVEPNPDRGQCSLSSERR